jgi:hypothetical protein
MPITFELAAASLAEREVAAEMLERVALDGYTVIADKGFAGEELESHMAGLGARLLRPDRKDEPRRNGSLGPVCRWIESVIWTCKGPLALERHGARTVTGVCGRVALRLLALAAGLIHNHDIGDLGRHFTAYSSRTPRRRGCGRGSRRAALRLARRREEPLRPGVAAPPTPRRSRR